MTISNLEHISKQEARRLMALRNARREAQENTQRHSRLFAQERFTRLISAIFEA